jgi:hypothetical protein
MASRGWAIPAHHPRPARAPTRLQTVNYGLTALARSRESPPRPLQGSCHTPPFAAAARKSNWKTAAFWLSNPPDPARQQKNAPLPKKTLARRSGKLRSRKLRITVTPPNSAKSGRAMVHSSFLNFCFQRFSSFQLYPNTSFPLQPPFPRPPVPPDDSFRDLHRKQIPSSQQFPAPSIVRWALLPRSFGIHISPQTAGIVVILSIL